MSKKRIIELALLVFITLAIILLSVRNRNSENIEIADSLFTNDEPVMEYGIPVDSFVVIKDKVRKNEFLSEILQHYGLAYQTIDQLVRKSKSVFDVRRIRAGNEYTVLLTNDSLRQFQVFVYEISPTSYLIYDLRDSVHVHKGEREIELREMKCSGIISSSLWNAMIENNTDPNLANELSEIYAWAIDFFGL